MYDRQRDHYVVLDEDGGCLGVGVDAEDAAYDAAQFLLKTGREVMVHEDGRPRALIGRFCTQRYAHAIGSRPAGIERLPAGWQQNRDGLIDLRPQYVRPRERSLHIEVSPESFLGPKL